MGKGYGRPELPEEPRAVSTASNMSYLCPRYTISGPSSRHEAAVQVEREDGMNGVRVASHHACRH